MFLLDKLVAGYSDMETRLAAIFSVFSSIPAPSHDSGGGGSANGIAADLRKRKMRAVLLVLCGLVMVLVALIYISTSLGEYVFVKF